MNRRPDAERVGRRLTAFGPASRVPTRSGQHRTPATPDGPRAAALRQGRVTNQPDTPWRHP
ncbi:hypothetical protein Ae406Ps2_6099 [Pseudonocardia sp. Ae406_Ps2]|nr:hypothetical protein Ae331Ps2_6071c [Pseudonocardia sp. Ae331_Ps2]OLL96263.1 hypothetical protein Ae406Ps2_6099 [Pseudonocardia sp. Ae406_Ps2]OLM28613.1 hypothetical protein Ae717Ps2_6209c [Pseudonocardia sp. Ae717_Ps2]